MEERALESVALHAQLQVGIGRFFARDLERIQIEHADAVVHDVLLRGERESRPHRFRRGEVALDDEHAVLLQAGQRVGVQEHLRVGRQRHVDAAVFAVDADRFRRRRQIVGGGLALLFRTVFRVGLDVPAEQFEQGHRQVLAGGHRAPAADRVHAHRDRALGHQVGIFRTAQRHLPDARVGGLQFLLAEFLFRRGRLVAHEIHRQVEELALGCAGQHVLHGGDQALRLQVARTEAVTAGIKRRHVLRAGIARILGIRIVAPVLDAFGDGGTHFAHQRQIFRQRLVGTLQHRHALFALEQLAQQVAGKGAEHSEIDHADLDLARLAQPVGNDCRLHRHAALADDEVVGIVAAVLTDALIAATGEPVELGHALFHQRRDVLEEIRALCGDRLHVTVLIGDHAGLHRIVHVPQLRHAAAGVAVQDALRRGGGVDDVVRVAEELRHQFFFRHQYGLDQVRGEEAVLRHHRRRQCQLGGFARDQVEIGRFLRVLRHHLDEAGVVGAVIIVVRAMHVERILGDRAAAHVQHVRQAFADRGVERFVHEGHALRGGEIHRAHPGHRQPRSDPGGGVFRFRFDEDERPAGRVQMPGGDRFRPVFAHLRRRRDRVGAGAVGGFAFHQDDRGVAVDRVAHPGIFEFGLLLGAGDGVQQFELFDLVQHGGVSW